MKQTRFIAMAAAALLTMCAVAQELTFTNGIIFVNEDWYGPYQGSLNYYNHDYDEMEYNVFNLVNPSLKLGVTTQFGQVFGGKLFLVSKQANYNEAKGATDGSRLAVLDAATLKQQASIFRFGQSPDSVYDGRSYCAVTGDKGYIATNAGILVLDEPSMTVSGPISGTRSSAAGDYNSLYTGQCGDMVRFGQYVFAVQQGKGLHVIDPAADTVVKTLPFPNIVTAFVTAGGNLYVANNSREIYDYGTGPFEADFTQIDPIALDVISVYPLGDEKGVMSSWGAWRPCLLCVDPVKECVYYNHEEYQNFISRYDFDTQQLTDTLVLLPLGVSTNWDGTAERQGLYASALSFDPHTGNMVVQTTEAAPMYAYQNFNHNWVLFYDPATWSLSKQVRLQDAYWFTAMAVYPDVCDPVVAVDDVRATMGRQVLISLLDVVTDDDNMAALAVATATSGDEAVARVSVVGLNIVIEAVSAGRTTVTLDVDSNGKLAQTQFSVIVEVTLPGDVNNDSKVSIDDVTDLIDILLGSATASDPIAADVDGDGRVGIDDVTALIDMLLGK